MGGEERPTGGGRDTRTSFLLLQVTTVNRQHRSRSGSIASNLHQQTVKMNEKRNEESREKDAEKGESGCMVAVKEGSCNE